MSRDRSDAAAEDGPGPSILVVEDELQLARNLKLLLERDGYEVETAPNGARGIELIDERPFDLVITDLIMPGVDGTQLMVHVAQRQLDTPVIVITGYGSMESAVTAIRQGAYDYLTKPFEYDIMKITIEKALERKRLKAELREYTEQLEAKVLERTAALEEMQGRLMRSERLAAVGELVSIIAHEVRNPLVAIGGFARRLTKTTDDPAQVSKLSSIVVEEVDRLESILQSMLDFSKAARPNLKPVDPAQLVAKSLILFETELKRSSIALELDFAEDVPEILLDGDQIRGVILNLVTNAVQAMPGGGRLTLRVRHRPEGVCIEVRDTGIGIREEQLDNLFEPFFTTKSTGTGLGLAIAHKVVGEHGGRIEVESDVGRGTQFRLVLPASGHRTDGDRQGGS